MSKIHVERMPTGVPDLDAIIEGFVKDRSYLISGEPGTGKTIFSIHFMSKALKDGHKVGLVTTEEPLESILLQASLVGMPLDKYVGNELKVVDTSLHRAIEASFATPTGDYLIQSFRDLLSAIPSGVDCVVIDTITPYFLPMNATMARETATEIMTTFREKRLTALLIMDEAVEPNVLRAVAAPMHGFIRLTYQHDPYTTRPIQLMYVRKLRATKTPRHPLMYEITETGIVIHKEKIPLE
ncbi:MAG: ATPase domain-containing protein [Thermoplasmata archaeon]